MNLRFRLIAGCVFAGVLVLSGCGTDRSGFAGMDSSVAATVDGHEISNDLLDAVAKETLSSDKFRVAYAKRQEALGSAPIDLELRGEPSKAFLSELLTQLITLGPLDAYADRLNIVTTDEDRNVVRTDGSAQILSSFFAPTVQKVTGDPAEITLETLSQDMQTRIVEEAARLRALGRELLRLKATNSNPMVDAMKAQDPDAVAKVCSRHILVGIGQYAADGVRSDIDAKKLADDLRAQLANGADFGELATKNSDDTGSAQKGGSLDCQPKFALSGFVPEFAAALETAKVDEISEPVKTDFGYHLIEVTERSTYTDAELSPLIDQSFQAMPEEPLDVSGWLLNGLLPSASIKVNPTIGTWTAEGKVRKVVPAVQIGSGTSTTTTSTTPDTSLNVG